MKSRFLWLFLLLLCFPAAGQFITPGRGSGSGGDGFVTAYGTNGIIVISNANTGVIIIDGSGITATITNIGEIINLNVLGQLNASNVVTTNALIWPGATTNTVAVWGAQKQLTNVPPGTSGQVLGANGTLLPTWKNNTLSNLSDVNLTVNVPVAGDSLVWDGIRWVNAHIYSINVNVTVVSNVTINVGTNNEQFLAVVTTNSFGIIYNGTPLPGERYHIAVLNSNAVLNINMTNASFNPLVASNVLFYTIPSNSIASFTFVNRTNWNYASPTNRWELDAVISKEMELVAGANVTFTTNSSPEAGAYSITISSAASANTNSYLYNYDTNASVYFMQAGVTNEAARLRIDGFVRTLKQYNLWTSVVDTVFFRTGMVGTNGTGGTNFYTLRGALTNTSTYLPQIDGNGAYFDATAMVRFNARSLPNFSVATSWRAPTNYPDSCSVSFAHPNNITNGGAEITLHYNYSSVQSYGAGPGTAVDTAYRTNYIWGTKLLPGDGMWHNTALSYSSDNNIIQGWNEYASSFSNAITANATGHTALAIGGSTYGPNVVGSPNYVGWIADVVLLDKQLTDSDAAHLREATRWLSPQQENWVFIGDSLTSVDGDATDTNFFENWPSQLTANQSFSNVALSVNLARIGFTSTNVIDAWTNAHRPWLPGRSGVTKTKLFLEIGFNDLYQGATTLELWSNVQRLCNLAQTEGMEVYLGTVPWSAFDTPLLTRRSQYNSLVASNPWIANTILRRDLLFTATNSTDYSASGLHYSYVGYRKKALQALEAITGNPKYYSFGQPGIGQVPTVTDLAGSITYSNVPTSVGSGSLQTNANQFAPNVVLNIKAGALLTNMNYWGNGTNAGDLYSQKLIATLGGIFDTDFNGGKALITDGADRIVESAVVASALFENFFRMGISNIVGATGIAIGTNNGTLFVTNTGVAGSGNFQSGSFILTNFQAMGISNIIAGTNVVISTNNGTLVVKAILGITNLADVTVNPQGGAGVNVGQILRVGEDGIWHNYYPFYQVVYNIGVTNVIILNGTNNEQNIFVIATNSFNVTNVGTPLLLEKYHIAILNSNFMSDIYMTNRSFDPRVGSNVSLYLIPSNSIATFSFISRTNWNPFGTNRWELDRYIQEEVELDVAGGLVLHTNVTRSLITISNSASAGSTQLVAAAIGALTATNIGIGGALPDAAGGIALKAVGGFVFSNASTANFIAGTNGHMIVASTNQGGFSNYLAGPGLTLSNASKIASNASGFVSESPPLRFVGNAFMTGTGGTNVFPVMEEVWKPTIQAGASGAAGILIWQSRTNESGAPTTNMALSSAGLLSFTTMQGPAGVPAVSSSGLQYGGATGYIGAGSGGLIFWTSRCVMDSQVDGKIRISNNAQTDFNGLLLGGANPTNGLIQFISSSTGNSNSTINLRSGNTNVWLKLGSHDIGTHSTNWTADATSFVGYTNTTDYNQIWNIRGTSGNIVFWNRTGLAGGTAAGVAIWTNTVTATGSDIVVGVNCGLAIDTGVSVVGGGRAF